MGLTRKRESRGQTKLNLAFSSSAVSAPSSNSDIYNGEEMPVVVGQGLFAGARLCGVVRLKRRMQKPSAAGTRTAGEEGWCVDKTNRCPSVGWRCATQAKKPHQAHMPESP